MPFIAPSCIEAPTLSSELRLLQGGRFLIRFNHLGIAGLLWYIKKKLTQ